MAQKALTDAECQATVNAVAKHGSITEAAKALHINRETLQNRYNRARDRKIVAAPEFDRDTQGSLKEQIRRLEAELKISQKQANMADAVKAAIGGLDEQIRAFEPPRWLVSTKSTTVPGVPTLFLSDLHWGERVSSTQIQAVNQYDVKIAHERMHNVVKGAIECSRIFCEGKPPPGLVLALGGDMISGNIHDELVATNEQSAIPAVIDLYGVLSGVITQLADEFGNLMIPCVGGNHGRDTHKIWNKERNNTSFDWMLYQFLARRFADDKRINFYIPDGPDAYFRIYDYRYLLTHGDQFRGGDSMIGALGPITRGDHKKRSRNAQIDMSYDTMMMGHWHQYIHLLRLIVNGSLKGYDEYAYSNNFGFELPQQAFWMTHPKYGMTLRAPIFADRVREPVKTSWASVPLIGVA